MTDFISNSAILTTIRSSAVLTVAPNSVLGREKWQTLQQSLPLLSLLIVVYGTARGGGRYNRIVEKVAFGREV